MSDRPDDDTTIVPDDTVVSGDTVVLPRPASAGDTVVGDRTRPSDRSSASRGGDEPISTVPRGPRRFSVAFPSLPPVTDHAALEFHPPEVVPGGVARYSVRTRSVARELPSWGDPTAPVVSRERAAHQLGRLAKDLRDQGLSWRRRAYVSVGAASLGTLALLVVGWTLLARL